MQRRLISVVILLVCLRLHVTFYRSEYFKMPSFLSYNSSKDLVPNQGSVVILDPDLGHIMLSFPYKFLLDIFNSLRLLPLSLLISLLLAQITNTVYTDTIVKIIIIKMS